MNTINRKHHSLKTDPIPFGETMQGRKLWEIRLNDRNFCEADTITLHETASSGREMAEGAPLEYTGRTWHGAITWILHGPQYGLAEGWCVFGVAPGFADTAEDIEASLQYYLENDCPCCGGSGHKDDCSESAEAVATPADPLPCPFCGSTDVGGAGGTVSCYRCPAEIAVQNANTGYAVELWNNRATTGAGGVPERWEDIIEQRDVFKAQAAEYRKAYEALLSTTPGNGERVKIESIEPDQFWDADNSEQDYRDPYDLADYASQDLRQGETMTVTVLCAKELPKRTMKIWINSNDEAEFDWIPQPLVQGGGQ